MIAARQEDDENSLHTSSEFNNKGLPVGLASPANPISSPRRAMKLGRTPLFLSQRVDVKNGTATAK